MSNYFRYLTPKTVLLFGHSAGTAYLAWCVHKDLKEFRSDEFNSVFKRDPVSQIAENQINANQLHEYKTNLDKAIKDAKFLKNLFLTLSFFPFVIGVQQIIEFRSKQKYTRRNRSFFTTPVSLFFY